MAQRSHIVIRGAREHNLKGVDLTLPRDSLIVFTGLSGSGKSSLAFDTLFREGQRRFMESLSAYARQFLGTMEKPKVDHIEGLSPTISIDQKTINRNPRSTVGTITEIYDHFRLLFARLGTPHCPKCGREVASQTPEQIADNLYYEAGGPVRGMILAPIVQDRKGEYRKELTDLVRDGWLRARIDGEVVDLRQEITLDRYVRHTIEVVLDRITFDTESRSRIIAAIEKAIEMSGSMVSALVEDRYLTFATERACPVCRISIPEMEPRTFSFNSPHGACSTCDGLGQTVVFSEHMLVPDPKKSIDDGAIICLTKDGRVPFSAIALPEIAQILSLYGVSLATAWQDLPEEARRSLMHGADNLTYHLGSDNSSLPSLKFQGILPALAQAYKYTKAEFLEQYQQRATCPSCHGKRLSNVALAVTFRAKSIWELSVCSVEQADRFFGELQLSSKEDLIGREIFKEIRARLHFLREVGLSYLSLDRSAATLSGGEAQRIRLASQVGSGLQGVLYVLDEPSIGLHPRDNRRLLNTLLRLRNLGNTVLVVEHDRETIEAADFLVDIGPGAGSAGGEITAQGTVARVLKSKSLTGRYLRGEEQITVPQQRRTGCGSSLTIQGARQNNLKNITVEFPLGTFISVTGVSGSGKSTLISDILRRALAQKFHNALEEPGDYDAIEGLQHLDKVIEIDQSPIGRTPRSNPATYTKVFDDIRGLFADVPEARMRGYSKGRFSFNVSGGRCEECQGAGVKEIEMQFLANVEIPCEACSGKRFNPETLAIRYKNHSIHDVLEMTIQEAAPFFSNHSRIRRTLTTLLDVGLGYVTLGQPSTTLSGGEAQRIKLASELQRPATGRTLYILDEPTTGLHMADIRRLLVALQQLVEAGNTVIVIEHNLDVIKVSDYVIDLGPEGGNGGGYIVATGTPEQITRAKSSYTGAFLRDVLGAGSAGERQNASASNADTQGDTGPALDEPTDNRPARGGARNLVVTGAHKNNLKHVSVTIPPNKMTVITGVSGSGKTSLAFDTLFAEGQRRYVESLSTYARRFLGRLDKAPVDSIEGISPSISVDQKVAARSPRSTVATSTEIHDYFRLLFARIGKPHCPTCGAALTGYSPTHAASAALSQFLGQRAEILAPLVGDVSVGAAPSGDGLENSEYAPPQNEVSTAGLLGEGFLRIRLDDEMVRIDQDIRTVVKGRRIELVLDRIEIQPDALSRITEGFESAFRRGNGIAWLRLENGGRAGFSTIPGCLKCGFFLREELTPQLFSFNSHIGACLRCDGLGTTEAIPTDRLISNLERPFLDGALHPVAAKLFDKRGNRYHNLLEAMAREEGFALHRPWKSLSHKAQDLLVHGAGETFYRVLSDPKSRSKRPDPNALMLKWRGMSRILEGWYQEARKSQDKLQEEMKPLMQDTPCPDCKGARLKRLPLGVRIHGLNIAEASARTVTGCLAFFGELQLSGTDAVIADQILKEIISRLGFLRDVGLEYLTLDRASNTLSGGEAQRIRLASQLGSHLMGVLYVLDEPTIGLHPRDTERLLGTLTGLRDRGNTVVVVEHDAQTIEKSDFVIDMGPGAGDRGGRIIAQGTVRQIMKNPASITGAFLSKKRAIPVPELRRTGLAGVTVVGATANNLKNITVHFPRSALVCVTGVSGSGKSTLVMDVLARGLARQFGTRDEPPAAHETIRIDATLQRVGIIDQSPLGKSPKSNPASYTGVMDHMRTLFASMAEAQARGYTRTRFSYNVPGGRCEACEGRGAIKVEMHFLSDVWVPCERCKGRRYNASTLQIKFKGKSIADVLDMEIAHALQFFENQPRIKRMIQPLEDVGLGYMQVGQASNTMSGGEAQRVKLAAALMERTRTGVYILDEPTTGLHFLDVERLIQVFQRLVDKGNTVVVIEHNPDVMKVSDWIIDLGPEGGAKGGQIVAQGTPEQIAMVPDSATGSYLAGVLKSGPRAGRPGSYAVTHEEYSDEAELVGSEEGGEE